MMVGQTFGYEPEGLLRAVRSDADPRPEPRPSRQTRFMAKEATKAISAAT